MRHMAGVQSVPRVQRGVPVVVPGSVDVPLSKRALAGLESQGLARTLGSLAGSTLGPPPDIEFPEECARPGEVLLAPGKCGPDPRKPLDPYATPPAVVSTGGGLRPKRAAAAAASGKDVVKGMSTTTIALAAVGAIGLIYYLGKYK